MRAVFVYRQDGLGNRLMAFGNGLRLARVLEVPCYLAWNEWHRVGGISRIGDLLDVEEMPASVTPCRFDQGLRELRPSRMAYAGHRDVIDREVVAGSDLLLCARPRMQRLSYEPDSPLLARDFAEAANCLAPAPLLADRAHAFAVRHDLAAAVGVHVRRGDLADHRSEAERIRLIGLDRYFAVLDAVAPAGPFFLCTEDQTVIEAFHDRYPARVLCYPTGSWARGDREATGDALIEMFLLGATRFVVGGPSGFSRFAAARTAIPLVVLENGESPQQSIALAEAAIRPMD